MVAGLIEVEELPSHANGRKGLGLSPAQRDARSSVQSAVAHFPPARPPTGWRQVPIKPPEDLPPFQPEAKVANKPKSEPCRKISVSVSPR